LIWSTPALVRESARKTSPVSSSMPTQYVMFADPEEFKTRKRYDNACAPVVACAALR
jgi:hypothetical protein